MTNENDVVVRDLQVSVMRLTEMLETMRQERDYYRDLAGSLYSAGRAHITGAPNALAAWSQAEELYRQDYV